jgi:hypothetical protein
MTIVLRLLRELLGDVKVSIRRSLKICVRRNGLSFSQEILSQEIFANILLGNFKPAVER